MNPTSSCVGGSLLPARPGRLSRTDRATRATIDGLTLGLSGAVRHACAALADGTGIVGVCEQERITRVRGAGFNSTGVPDEAIDALLAHEGATRDDIARIAGFSDGLSPDLELAHHHAHACTAYLSSPFRSATIVICDNDSVGVSVWRAEGNCLEQIEWPWTGQSPCDLYRECARLLGFTSAGGDQRFEALARMMAERPDEHLLGFFTTDGCRVAEAHDWRDRVIKALSNSAEVAERAQIAAALQRQIGKLAVEILTRVQAVAPSTTLCLGGALFHHSSINSAIRMSNLFQRVFVPANPGDAGLAVGAAMHAANLPPGHVSAFLGPSYDIDGDIKGTLDNCKLRYDFVDRRKLTEIAIDNLIQGRLVGWFEGRMEWGPRALGARTILASPVGPFVLENLNRFLKRREPWRGYALSVLAEDTADQFCGPTEAPFMECDYQPKDPEKFRHVMPSEWSHLRVQTVSAACPPGFHAVLKAFKSATGIPCLVNTSFNGFHEPIVCTPRDAIRVFFGSGLDVLMLDRFVLTK
jgi:carbamoyltransferase